MKTDRRKFLTGLGTTLSLPFLEYFAPKNVALAASGAKRVVYLYLGNGAQWQPDALGTNFQLPTPLSALAPLQEYVTVLSGLNLGPANQQQGGDHARACTAFLSGQTPASPGPGVARTIDLQIADVIGKSTKYSNLCLGGERHSESDSGYAAEYTNSISWLGGSSPNTREIDPVAVFERMFSGGSPQDQRVARSISGKSVLDFVLGQANTLNAALGQADKARLQAYLQSVRELESRLQAGGSGPACQTPVTPVGTANYAQNIGLLYDVLYHALACGMTNVASFIVASETSPQSYDFIGVQGGHHEISHDSSSTGYAKIAQIAQWHIGQFANFCQKLKNAPEDSGNMLDNSILVFGGGLSDGTKHNHVNIPVALVGKGGGAIPGGRHLRYDGMPFCNLHVTVAGLAGAGITQFGDSTGPLSLT